MSLRESQAAQVRTRVLDAAIAALETREIDDLSMAEIASEAGVSLRTLYRYFADRSALLDAAGEHLYASLRVPIEIAAPEDIASNFRRAAKSLSSRPKLARALVTSGAGRRARSGVRSQRLNAIRVALAPLTDRVRPEVARHASATIAHLCSAASWIALAEETGMPDREAQEAIAWAIERLVWALRQEAEAK